MLPTKLKCTVYNISPAIILLVLKQKMNIKYMKITDILLDLNME